MDYEKIEKEIHETLLDSLEKRVILCSRFTGTRNLTWEDSLQAISRSDLSSADNHLMQKMATAFAAFERGDAETSKKAFLECGAIIIRCVNFLEEHEIAKPTANRK